MRNVLGIAVLGIAALALDVLLTGCRTTQPVHAGPRDASLTEPDPMLSVNTLHDAPEDYALQRIDSDEFPIPSYARHLKGVKICLDPGHGGDAHKRGFKRGPTGVREAEMNLRVTQYLRDLLVYCEAEVLLTREEDLAVSLPERGEIANQWGADLFLSCHHNATSKPEVNRTSVWYHRDVDFRPANLDLARYVLQGLQDGLALEQTTGVPLKSDQLMYKGGFGILRACKVTAALTESSFFTNPEEEQRLRDPYYSLVEAYAIFLGFAKYAAAGIPRLTMIEPQDGLLTAGEPTTLRFQLDDGLRSRGSWGADRQMIITSSIDVRVDAIPMEYDFTNDGYRLSVELPDGLSAGDHTVTIQFQNMFKNSVINPDIKLTAE